MYFIWSEKSIYIFCNMYKLDTLTLLKIVKMTVLFYYSSYW